MSRRPQSLPGNYLLHPLALCLLLAAFAGCVQTGGGGKTTTAKGQGQPAALPAASGLQVELLLTDLGLQDGAFCREADAALTKLQSSGSISYNSVGVMPVALGEEAGKNDIGLPPGSFGMEAAALAGPGEMTQAAAEKVLDAATDCDLLVLSAPTLLTPALVRIASGKLKAGAILLLDNDGLQPPATKPSVPVYVFHYDIAPAAFCLGVAAAASSSTPLFTVMTSQSDPDAHAFKDAVYGGIKYRTNGANTLEDDVEIGADGLVKPEDFASSFTKIKKAGGSAFSQCNHYIIDLGRTTPSIMYALSSNETHGYVLGAYSDFSQVRPARFVCCAEKHPGKALDFVFAHLQDLADLDKLAAWGTASGSTAGQAASSVGEIAVGIDQDAVGITDLTLYSRYNPDGDDIAEAVNAVWGEIKSGEFDYKATIEGFKRRVK